MSSPSPARGAARAWRPGPRLVGWASRAFTLAFLVALVGMLPFLSGRDPALAVLRARSAEQLATDEALAAVRRDLGLGSSAWETLGLWLGGLARGDLGTSWVSGAPVLPGVLGALGVSLTLMGAALAVALLIAAALLIRPVRAGLAGRARAGSGLVSASLTALPEFLLASLLLIVLSVWLGWLPPYGWAGPQHLVLPALALGIPAGGLCGRLATEAVTAAFREPWVHTWEMSGFTRRQITAAVLRRALPSLLPQLGLVLVGLTGGAVAVEQVFTVPGIGRTALGAAASADLPVVQASVMALLLLGITAGVLARLGSRLLLGTSVEARALAASTGAVRARRAWWCIPAACAAVLVLVTALGTGLDPYAMAFDRLAAPGAVGPAGAAGSGAGAGAGAGAGSEAVAWLGADASGRDVLARLGHGALTTVALALACALVSWVVGLALGMAPSLSLGPLEAANAMPPVLAGLIVATLLGPSAWGATLAVLLVSWAPLAAHAASLREEASATAYADMAPLLGIRPWRYQLRTVLPTIAGPVFRHAMLRVPGIALAIASLGFLGLGPQPPRPDWGLMLADGIDYMERAPWVALAPMGALVLLSVLAVSASSRRV